MSEDGQQLSLEFSADEPARAADSATGTESGSPRGLSRRSLLRGGLALGVLSLVRDAAVFAPHDSASLATGDAEASMPESPQAAGRLERAAEIRVRVAQSMAGAGLGKTETNGDELGVPRYAAAFSKCLPHDSAGDVDQKAYETYLKACRSGSPRDFEAVPLGGYVKLANPQAGWAYDLLGPDAWQGTLAVPPKFSSEEQLAEMVENYWHALLRDVAYADYDKNPLALRACEELTRFRDFRGPREGGKVTPQTLFRGQTPGDLAGPYISQFLYKDLPLLPMKIEQRIRTAKAGVDFMTTKQEWLGIQNGMLPRPKVWETVPVYMRNGRDLGEYVHRDFTYQAFVCACLLALRIGTPLDGGNPYKHARTQSAFTTFGQPTLIAMLAIVTQASLKCCWYQKWALHRRLRPEELGGRVENVVHGQADYPLPAGLLESEALREVVSKNGTAYLPQAYPEGCPVHPSYPAGHAVIAGACTTILKALLDDSFPIPDPVEAKADGLGVQPWTEGELTVGGELDKLAANISIGRDTAGVHWRSDAIAGMKLGEDVAIEVLRQMRQTETEICSGWTFRAFDGRVVTTG